MIIKGVSDNPSSIDNVLEANVNMVMDEESAMLQTLSTHKEKNEPKSEKSESMKEINELNDALKSCSFGWFHITLLCSSFLAQINSSAIGATTSYILPSAECDLNMSFFQKGVLNAATFVGMCITSIFGGFLTDAFGRKTFLVYGFGGITFFTVFSSLSQTFYMLVFGKFCEGLLFAVAYNPLVTAISEFCHNGIRDRITILHTSFMALGGIIMALISWGILPHDWTVSFLNGKFVLHTWNFYLLITALFPCGAFIMFCFLPETPKYLLSQHRYDDIKAILFKMYVQNTSKAKTTYPYKDLWSTKNDKVIKPELTPTEKFKCTLIGGLRNCKPLFQKQLLFYLLLICFMMFLNMMIFNIVRLWYPQLSTIVEHYRNESVSQDLCVMLDDYTNDQKMIVVNVAADEVCVPVKSGSETYINSIILGSVCMMAFLINGILVNKLGKKLMIMIFGVVSTACTLYLRWASSKTEIVALFATDLAIAQNMMALLQTTAIEVFPTTSRSLAISLVMLAGRIGTLVGNLAFPILLDISCFVAFFTMAGIMLFVTFLSVFLPKKEE